MAEYEMLPCPGSKRYRDNRFYELCGGGCRMKLLEAMIEIQVPELLSDDKSMSAVQICSKLGFEAKRGWKFLHALSLAGLLVEEGGSMGEDSAKFSLHSDVKLLYRDGSYFYKDYIAFQRYVDAISSNGSIINILKGGSLGETIKWPPQTPEAAAHLEHWMTITSQGALNSLFHSKSLEGVENLLDVGGGDGTIALALTKHYNTLKSPTDAKCHVSVFNLPNSAQLARDNIRLHSCPANNDCVCVIEGDFVKDHSLPAGHDCIMFSRVLADWSPEDSGMMLKKARDALISGPKRGGKGRLIISEPLMEGNRNLCLAWEYRYIFSDNFGKSCYKSINTYVDILTKLGFSIRNITPMTDDNFYTVIVAEIDC